MKSDSRLAERTGAPWALALGALLVGVAALAAQKPPEGTEQEPATGSEVAAGLSPLELRGKEIYMRGESPSGDPVTALMGVAAVEVPASALPCANCHGRDGKGKPEGGVEPSNLTWDALTKPYGVRHSSGREHPPYTPRLLKRAIAMGFDPAGNELHVAMPRYRMTLEDMDALIAYIQRLGFDPDPGLSSDALQVGTLLPPPGRAQSVGNAISSVLTAYFDEINAGGGLYNRKLVLHEHRLPEDPARWRSDVKSFLEQEEVFALVGAFIAGADAEIPAAVAELGVPLVGPFTLHPQTGFPLNRQVFYLLPGIASQLRVLTDTAARRHAPTAAAPRPAAALVFPTGEELAAAVEAAQEQARKNGWNDLLSLPVGPGAFDAGKLARQLAEAGVGVLFVLHPQCLEAGFLAAADQLGWHPEIYAPGVFAGAALLQAPPGFQGKILLSFPSLPADQSPRGVEQYRRLAKEHDLAEASLTTQLATLAAAEVLVEGLKRAGRDLSRAKLIDALEKLYDYRTGLTPPLTFGPNRRIGALGAYVVSLDLETRRFEPLSGWQSPQ